MIRRFLLHSIIVLLGGLTGASTCALTAEGRAYCWGQNFAGSLGNGTSGTGATVTPMPVSTSLTFASIAVSNDNNLLATTCAATSTGEGYCWGMGDNGELGSPANTTCSFIDFQLGCSTTPQRIAGGVLFRNIDAGAWHGCGISLHNQAYCWGYNESGEIGDGTTANIRQSPVRVISASMVTSTKSALLYSNATSKGQKRVLRLKQAVIRRP
jgi:hypothetical protein